MRRAVLAALAAIGMCGASEPPKQPSDKQQEAQATEAKSGPSPPATAPAPLKQVEEAPAGKDGRENDKGDPSRHLQEYGIYAAIAQAVIGIAGLIGLLFTVLYAKRAWSEAKRSSDAARDGLDHARADAAEQTRRFEAQLRIAEENLKIAQRAAAEVDHAWLSLDVTPISALRIEDEAVSIDVQFVTKNIGKAPAIGVDFTRELTFDLVSLDRNIRENPGLRVLSGRFGETLFPGRKRVDKDTLQVDRKDFDEAIAKNRASGNPSGVYPIIALGVRYSLPGDNTRRLTYAYLVLARKERAKARFDGGETAIELDDLTWVPHPLTGPVT